MSIDNMEPDFGRLVVQTCAEYLRDREAFLKSFEHEVRIPVSGAVLDSVDLLPGSDDRIHQLDARHSALINQALDQIPEQRETGDSHSGR